MVDVYGNLNLKQNQPTFMVLHKGSSFPSSPTPLAGQLFYRSDENKVYYYNGSTWTEVGSGGGGGGSGLGKFIEAFTSQTSVTVTHNLGDLNPIVQVYDSNNEQITPDLIDVLSGNQIKVEFNTAQTGFITIHGGQGVDVGTTAYYSQAFTNQTNVTVAHGLNQKYVSVTVFDDSDSLIEPQSVTLTDADNLDVVFGVSTSGTVVVAGGNLATTIFGVKRFEDSFSAVIQKIVNHNLNDSSPIVQVYNSSGEVIFPDMTVISANAVQLDFGSSSTGTVQVVGGLQATSPGAGTADFLPDTTDLFDLGSGTFKWKDGHFSGKLYVDGGIDPEYIQLEPQAVEPDAGLNNKLWFDSSDSYKLKIKDESGDNLEVIHLDNTGKLPAVDGNNLTNLPSFQATGAIEPGLNYIRMLETASVSSSKGGYGGWAEAYIDVYGRNGTVNYNIDDLTKTNALFDWNDLKWYCGDGFVDGTQYFSGSSNPSVTLVKTYTPNEIIKKISFWAWKGSGSSNEWVRYVFTYADLSTQTINTDINPETPTYYEITSMSQTKVVTSLELWLITGNANGTWSKWHTYFYDNTGEVEILHTGLPTGTFNSDCSQAIGVPMIEDWEDGADIKYKLLAYPSDDVDDAEDAQTTLTASSSVTYVTGLVVEPTTNPFWLKSVTKHASSTATRALVRNENNQTLATANFIGDVATFSPMVLIASAGYRLLVDAEGASYLRIYAGGGFPIVNTNSTFRYGFSNTSQSTSAFSIISIVGQSTTPEDSGWLNCGANPVLNEFTAFTGEPLGIKVKMTPKTTTPTDYYPSIKGFYISAR